MGRLNSRRMDGQAYQLWYLQRPLAATAAETSRSDFVQGQCPVVAVLDHWANYEDAIVFKRGFVERGGMRVFIFTTRRESERVGASDREEICNPLKADPVAGDTLNVNNEADYSKLEDDGVPPIGTWITDGDVVIGKVIKVQALDESGLYVTQRYDVSKQYRGEDCVVDKVMRTTTGGGKTIMAVRLRAVRSVKKGDKFASRHGQKGVCGHVEDDENMPFVETGCMAGVSPDIIMTPYAFPSRMTIGHTLETQLSRIAAQKGKFCDATPWTGFEHKDMEELLRLLRSEGGEGEKVRMRCGMTGELLQARVFMGITFYNRLVHLVLSKVRARNRGPRMALTRQPKEGKSKGGGLKFGEMERDVVQSHGAGETQRDRMVTASDAYHIFVCGACHTQQDSAMTSLDTIEQSIEANGGDSRFEPRACTSCGAFKVVRVDQFPYATKLALAETEAMGIKSEIGIGIGIGEI